MKRLKKIYMKMEEKEAMEEKIKRDKKGYEKRKKSNHVGKK
jgi:hypothetical protein